MSPTIFFEIDPLGETKVWINKKTEKKNKNIPKKKIIIFNKL